MCRGCMRFAHEVNQWNGFSTDERRLVLERLDAFLARVLANRVDLFDAGLLAAALDHRRIPRDPARDPHRWLYDLLSRCGHDLPKGCGFRLRPDGREPPSPSALCRAVERDCHALSMAHYERYVEPGLRFANH